MAKRRDHLRNAPIVEAAIDFRVLRREDATAELFAQLSSAVGKQYPQAMLVHSIEARFGMAQGASVEPTPVTSAVGWQYRAESAVAQFRIDGFTFSKLEPYTKWEEVFAEAMRLWRVYVQTAQPTEVVRIAVRYINQLRVPLPAMLQEYLEVVPTLPPPSPQQLRQFLYRAVVDDTNRKASAVVVLASEPAVDPSTMVLLIDIDAFKENLSLAPDDPSLPHKFSQLRDLKNEIFFASITEKTVEMYA